MDKGINLDKKEFYKKLKPFSKNKHNGIQLFMYLDNEFRCQLIFGWSNSNPNGEFNPMMYAQLLDMHKVGSHRYIVPDLNWNCVDENTTTDYKLYKFLKKWIYDATSNYDWS